MVHANTERFIDDWRTRRGGQRLPHRRDLDPTLFGRLAPQLFMLGTDRDGQEEFRVAGCLFADLHGRELAGSAFSELWAPASRLTVLKALSHARRAAAPVLLQAAAQPALGEPVPVELTLCPVLGPSGQPDRTFGLYQPAEPLAGLYGRTVQAHVLTRVELMSERPETGLRLATLDGRHVA